MVSLHLILRKMCLFTNFFRGVLHNIKSGVMVSLLLILRQMCHFTNFFRGVLHNIKSGVMTLCYAITPHFAKMHRIFNQLPLFSEIPTIIQ